MPDTGILRLAESGMERGRKNVVVVGVTVVRMILSVARRGDEAGITSVGRERVSGREAEQSGSR